MQDVARLAKVSVKTVSNVVNDFPYVRPATRARVEEAISHLGYQMNSSARNLRSGRTGMISLAIPALNQPYYAELAQSVIDEAEAHGLTVLVETTSGQAARELNILTGSRRQLVDGTIFVPIALTRADLERLPPDVPLVLVGEQLLDSAIASHVTMANLAAAFCAVTHLAQDVGCRRIALIGRHPAGMTASALRLKGYRQALEAAGLPFDPTLVVDASAWHRDSGSEGVAQLLDAGVEFDGLFCFNDALALGAMRELSRRGTRIPHDVAVVGFDDTEDGRFSTPSLTSIDPGGKHIASTAVRLLQERMAGTSNGAEEITVEYRLVRRESTARRGRPRAVAATAI